MIKGKSIVELAQELEARQAQKQDFVADTREMELSQDGRTIQLGDSEPNPVRDIAHGQIAQRTGIPKKYYDTMREETPDLLAANVNRWFNEKPARRMVRTLNGDARAFLSDKYRRVENEQIAEAVLPALLDTGGGFEIVSSEVTDSRMYIQARLPRLEGAVKVGDPVQAGLIISNSEVGLGAIDISPMVYRLICTNGMVSGRTLADGRVRRTHLGAKVQAGDDNIVYSADTQEASDRALMLQIRDAIKQLSDPAQFARLMEQMKEAADSTQKVDNPVRAVEALTKAYSLPKLESEGILESLIKGQDYTRWGVLNAVTEQANTHASYDRAVELERLGGDILHLNSRDWHKIANAA